MLRTIATSRPLDALHWLSRRHHDQGLVISAPVSSAAAKRLVVLRELWPFLRPYRKQIATTFVLLSLGSVTILLVPLAFRNLIDVGFGQGAKGPGYLGALNLNQHFLALFGLAALWALAVGVRYYTVTWIGERVTADLRSAVYARVLTQSPQFFETLQTGEVLSRLTGDTTLIQIMVGSSVSMGLRSLFQFTGGMIMLAVTSLHLFSLNFALMALLALPLFAIGRLLRTLSRESQDRIADASALAGEILNAMPTVQSYTQEQNETKRFAARAETSFVTAIKRTRVRALLIGLLIIAVSGTIIFVLWIGARQVSAGTMTGGQLASFIFYAAMVAGAIGTSAEVWGDIMRAAGATERLLELLRARPAVADVPAPRTLPTPAQAVIKFEHVGFRYPARPDTPALDDINFIIHPDETVALVGPSGAGKTTVFQLLLRFYDVSSGVIRFNDMDIRELALHDLRNRIALVPQEPVIFSTNALENIRYGRPGASDHEVMAAACTRWSMNSYCVCPTVITPFSANAVRVSRVDSGNVSRSHADIERRTAVAIGRSHQCSRRRIGNGRASRSRCRDARSHHPHHRPPPRHRAAGTTHCRPGARPHY